MAKQGQQHHDSPGRNNPGKSETITTGTYKKHETTHQQHVEHQAGDAEAQHAAPPHEHAREGKALKSTSREMEQQPEGRTGSESNAD